MAFLNELENDGTCKGFCLLWPSTADLSIKKVFRLLMFVQVTSASVCETARHETYQFKTCLNSDYD